MAEKLIKQIEDHALTGCPPQEIADALGLPALDEAGLAAHRRGAARGRVLLREALLKAARKGDGRCIALLAGALGVEGDNIDDEAARFRAALRRQMRAEAGEVDA